MKTKELNSEDRYMFHSVINNLETMSTIFSPNYNLWNEAKQLDERKNVFVLIAGVRRKLQSFVHVPNFVRAELRQHLSFDILQVAWFTGRGNIGIVIIQNDHAKERKAYLGVHNSKGEEQDPIFIAEHGNKFPLEAAEIIMKHQGFNIQTKIRYGKLVYM